MVNWHNPTCYSDKDIQLIYRLGIGQFSKITECGSNYLAFQTQRFQCITMLKSITCINNTLHNNFISFIYFFKIIFMPIYISVNLIQIKYLYHQ